MSCAILASITAKTTIHTVERASSARKNGTALNMPTSAPTIYTRRRPKRSASQAKHGIVTQLSPPTGRPQRDDQQERLRMPQQCFHDRQPHAVLAVLADFFDELLRFFHARADPQRDQHQHHAEQKGQT